jgi:prevent-host-death family protein
MNTISVSEAKNKLSVMLDWAVKNQDEVIIASRGQPKAVILPYDEYEELTALRVKARRQKALQRLQELAATVQAQNKDMTLEQAEELATVISNDTIERMTKEGKVSFAKS